MQYLIAMTDIDGKWQELSSEEQQEILEKRPFRALTQYPERPPDLDHQSQQ